LVSWCLGGNIYERVKGNRSVGQGMIFSFFLKTNDYYECLTIPNQ